jgi:sugar lactone lactonase YvrE
MHHLTQCKVVEAEVFMRLPDHLRRDKAADLTPWARQQHPGVPIAAFLEGPSFDRVGNLYCVDIAHGRIFKTTPDGTVSVVTEYDGEPNGLKNPQRRADIRRRLPQRHCHGGSGNRRHESGVGTRPSSTTVSQIAPLRRRADGCVAARAS